MKISRTLNRLLTRGDALRTHFDLGLRAYDAADPAGVSRHRAAVGLLPEGGTSSLPFLALRWRELWLEGRHEEALEVAREAARRFPEDLDTVLELADVLQEMRLGSAAAELLVDSAERFADEPDVWYEAGVACERIEDWEGRLRCFERVWELEHDQEPTYRLWLPEERFMDVAEATLERLPPRVRENLGNVVIIVEDYPEEWIFDTDVGDPRLLGLFDGPGRASEAGVDFVAMGPSRIYLFRWNIERMCGSDAEVEEQVEITVLHEVGHYLGLEEDELHLRGLG
ncbi:MAG: metallopeptidase family protein [Myxococcota bacterium]